MSDADRTKEFIEAGLDSLGIEADEIELAVMAAAHAVFSPGMATLLAIDTSGITPERNPDLSRAP